VGALPSAVLLVSHRHQEATGECLRPNFHPGRGRPDLARGPSWVTEGAAQVSQSPPRTSDDQRDHLPMTLTLALTMLAAIAVAVFVFDAITPPKR
jgi:hypothetical protein